MDKTVSESLAQLLVQAGVHRLYGTAGSTRHPLAAALLREPALRHICVRHEESAAFAACAEAQLTGRAAACCGSSGSGTLHLLNGLFDAHRSGAPVLVLAAQIPTPQLGRRFFSETRAESLLRVCSAYAETICTPSQASAVLAEALRTARARRDVGAVVLPSDVAALPAGAEPAMPPAVAEAPSLCPSGEAVRQLAVLVNGARRVTFLCGIGCAGAERDIVALARRVQAPVAYTLRAKDMMEGNNPCEVGMTGMMGWGGAPVAVADCDLLVMWGTDFPFAEFLPQGTPIAQVDADAAALGRRVPLALGVHGDAGEVARALLPLVARERGDEHLAAARCLHRRKVAELESAVRMPDDSAPLRPEYITRLVSDLAEPDAVFTVDSGAPVLWAARYLRTADARRLLGSFKHGSTTCALAMAIGAKAAYPSRQVIALCSAAGLSMLPGDMLTLMQERLSVKIFVYNPKPAASGEEERLWQMPATDVAAMARGMGMAVERVSGTAEAGAAVKRWLAEPGPALLDAVTDGATCALPPCLHTQRGGVGSDGFTLSQGWAELRHMLFGPRGNTPPA